MGGIFSTQLQGSSASPISICTLSAESLGVQCGGVWMGALASQAWSVSNRAILIPFVVNSPFTFSKLSFRTGATPTANIDIGVYTSTFVRVISTGTTAIGGADALQTISVASTTLVPGRYYFALAMDSTSGTIGSSPFSDTMYARGSGILSKDSAFPLPATITAPSNSGVVAAWGVPFIQATSV